MRVKTKLLLQILASGLAVNVLAADAAAGGVMEEALRSYNSATPDYRAAYEKFETAAKAGSPLAEFYLGYCALNGTGTARNAAAAVRHFRKQTPFPHGRPP